MSSPPEWFAPLSLKLVASAPVELRPAMLLDHAELASRLALAPADLVDAARNRFASATVGAIFSALPPEISALIPDLAGAVGDVQAALLGEIGEALAPLQEASQALRQIADTAWALARAPADLAASVLRAETIANTAAMATGLPPVTAAWALAMNTRQVFVLQSEALGIAARAADAAWAAVVRVLDMIRSAVFDAIGSMADMVEGALSSITASIPSSIATAASSLSSQLSDAIGSVIPPVPGI